MSHLNSKNVSDGVRHRGGQKVPKMFVFFYLSVMDGWANGWTNRWTDSLIETHLKTRPKVFRFFVVFNEIIVTTLAASPW